MAYKLRTRREYPCYKEDIKRGYVPCPIERTIQAQKIMKSKAARARKRAQEKRLMNKAVAKAKEHPELCFICQKKEPAYRIKTHEEFLVCETCKDITEQELKIQNNIVGAIAQHEWESNRQIFRQILGVNLNPKEITIEKL